MDDDTSPNIRGMYIAYQITNDGTARDDVWAKINVPVFGSSANITLSQNEDGLVQLGSMAANETKTAFFYLGKLIEFNNTKAMFISPGKKQTEDYITGRFG